jgi:hypothetical protein
MPWCDDCSRFYGDTVLTEGGSCPGCGRTLAAKHRGTPWHFKVLLVAFCIYMVYRIYWLAEWLPKHL